MKIPRDVVQDWVAAYNRQDAHAEAELCHEDATNLQVALGEPTIGRQAILDNLLSLFRPPQQLHPHGISERTSETGRKAAAEYREASFKEEGVVARILAARKQSS